MRHDPEVRRAADTYQLGLLRVPVIGRSGELLGRSTGSSLEFQEYREYTPGDDIRHLDWAAYARSDMLMVRLYREEISPRTEILLDASKSMTSGDGAKPLVARQLTGLFALLAGALGGRPTTFVLNDDRPLRPLSLSELDALDRLPFDAATPLPEALDRSLVTLKRQSVRIVISDFLFPHDPGTLIRQLAANASTLWIVQLLNAWEADPSPLGGRRLVDIESQAELDLLITRKTIADYVARLRSLQESLALECRRAHATFVTLVADRGLQTLCREDLCGVGILRGK